MNITPTTSAVETAIRNAERDSKNYSLIGTLAADGLWLVAHKSGDKSRQYLVDTKRGTCQCEAFARMSVCKHQRMIDEELQIRQAEAELDAMQEGRYCIEAGKF